jgi:methylenetetrahydrofolate--tRNA-(uracil-5-)-methyltransferase
VGFQTRMAYGEQVRIFRMIPGLENAEFLKLGSIHRNLYVNSPKRLNRDLSSKNDPWLFFAGQITGVEGYFESTCIGLLVALFIDQKIKGQELNAPPRESGLGSLLEAITDPTRADHFQPTNINFGLFPPLSETDIKELGKLWRKKAIKKERQIEKAKTAFAAWAKTQGLRVPELPESLSPLLSEARAAFKSKSSPTSSGTSAAAIPALAAANSGAPAITATSSPR